MFRVAVFLDLTAIAIAYFATNPGYADLNSKICLPYGKSAVLESDDCKTAIDCGSWSKPKLLNCVRGVNRILEGSSCVYKKASRCENKLKERKKICTRTGAKYVPDSKFCHLYYECKDPTDAKICPYPKLFSKRTNSCQDFKRVRCGRRIKLKSYCQYDPKPCAPYCLPCELNHPNCEGFSDGVHPHSKKTGAGSPWYMVCRRERFIKEGLCPHARYGFDARNCEIAECDKTINKYYPSFLCNGYIWCYYGSQYKQRCPAGTVFDVKRRYCNHPYMTCQPCGKLAC